MTAQAGDTFLISAAAQKTSIRKHLRRLRQQIPRAERSLAARLTAQKLLRLRRVQGARSIAVYVSTQHELSTAPLIEGLLKTDAHVFTPCVGQDHKMVFVPLKQQRKLRADALGMRTPLARRPRCSARQLDVIVLPLVGFDLQGNRIGMGAGYYDRALQFRRIGKRPWLLGYAYRQQQTSVLAAESWDVKLDDIALASGVQHCSRSD